MGPNGELKGVCTCPVGCACKHAVALALVASKALQKDDAIADAGRLGKGWEMALEELDCLACDRAEEAENDDVDERDEVQDHVAGLGEEELRDLILELIAVYPSVREHIAAKLALRKNASAAKPASEKKKLPANIVPQARRAIKDATQDYYDPYDRYGYDEVPDYSVVLSYFEDLRDAGDWKNLMALGKELKRRANEQAERSAHDEGEICREASRCMDVVAQAVMESDLDSVEKVKWEAEIKADDSFSVLYDMEVSYRTALKTDSAGWKKIADYLVDREVADHVVGCTGLRVWASWSDVAQAFENAGNLDEAIRTLRDRLEDYDALYVDLAELLERHGRLDEAKAVCREGMARLPDDSYETTSGKLREKLRGWAEAEGDVKSIAAYDLAGFLSHLWIGNYDELKKSCEKADAWERVQDFLRRHFETGCPVVDEKRWPLPKIEVRLPDTTAGAFPNYDMLIDLAVKEGRGLDALKWFKARPNKEERTWGFKRDFSGGKEWDVADAVSDLQPDAALEIWRGLVAKNLECASEECYRVICKALAKMQPVMKKAGRLDEWLKGIADIRSEYKRRRNLVKLLDDLVRERGISSRIADYQEG
ncbi:MAG: hypothetical protein K6G91_11250 [Kiritimatiellae bacterium]|nr:hypothetical protein [Kiritimatiellia bacterium]